MFERLFLMLYPYISNSAEMLSMVREMEDLIFNERDTAVAQYRDQYRIDQAAHDKQVHELLVALCLSNYDVVTEAAYRKITAIKHLRKIVSYEFCSLRAAKDAIEDQRVVDASRRANGDVADCEQ